MNCNSEMVKCSRRWQCYQCNYPHHFYRLIVIQNLLLILKLFKIEKNIEGAVDIGTQSLGNNYCWQDLQDYGHLKSMYVKKGQPNLFTYITVKAVKFPINLNI